MKHLLVKIANLFFYNWHMILISILPKRYYFISWQCKECGEWNHWLWRDMPGHVGMIFMSCMWCDETTKKFPIDLLWGKE
jgi:hypothetical protein